MACEPVISLKVRGVGELSVFASVACHWIELGCLDLALFPLLPLPLLRPPLPLFRPPLPLLVVLVVWSPCPLPAVLVVRPPLPLTLPPLHVTVSLPSLTVDSALEVPGPLLPISSIVVHIL